jgi:hypothetical protein
MSRQAWQSLLLCSALLTIGSAASAEDEVAHRLTKFGKLSSGDAHRVVQSVSGRMKRAADMTSDSDPLRLAVSNALYGSSVSRDAMAAAKIRLKLYAGLNEWALENLFAAKPGSMATCTTQFGLGKHDCEALLAAGGKVSIADASRLGAGAPLTPAPGGSGFGAQQQPAFVRAAPAYGQPAPAQASRFGGGYNSGYGAAQPAYAAAPAAARYGAAQPRPVGNAWAGGAPAAQPAPMAVARPLAPPPPSANVVASRKAEYERQRQAYLDRKRQEMEARKAKVVSTAGGTERVQRGPSTADEAAVMGVAAPSESTKAAPAKVAAAAPAKAAGPAAADAPLAEADAPAPAPAAGGKAALDNDFLDGLLGDPLGKK